MTNSRNKGKRGELEWAEYLRGQGFDARRGVQFRGGSDSPDVVSESLSRFHFEVKRVEAGNPYDWLTQSIRDSRSNPESCRIPLVAHRRNNQEWIMILRADDFFNLLLEKGA